MNKEIFESIISHKMKDYINDITKVNIKDEKIIVDIYDGSQFEILVKQTKKAEYDY
jgi:hypothetical protein